MATYKVIQDVEAEDKLIGPLTLRQFIYGAVAGVCIWLCVMSYMKGVPFVMLLLVPVALVAGFLAFPWGGDQKTETWAVFKLRYLLLPRKRIWDQDGQNDLVTITVPKKIEKRYTDGLSETEVKSRLKALSTTLDTRGWALQNQPHDIVANQQGDRLFSVSTTLPQPVIADTTRPQDDMLDYGANPTASHLTQLVDDAARAQREALMNHLTTDTPYSPPTTPYRQPAQNTTPNTDWFSPRESTAPSPTAPSIRDEGNQKKQTETQQTQATSVRQTAIMDLASNDDLDIATLSRQANQRKVSGDKPNDDGEVVIPLR